eukprot:TRINITY_DN8642_c0_g1_i4.p1 TRINITY_DN8642_c0_g1~~TRINITY_DN8642_c0_g1_i4.p1  ORF type:complete len:255 (-),score=5.11 TRINITY_DN8642_c0_g1_i4:186-950(-)
MLTIPQNIFETDLNKIQQLNHPNIVKYLGIVEKPRRALVMELMRCDLGTYIYEDHKDEPIREERIYYIGWQIASALDFLHKQSPKEFISHGDFHIGNIMMDFENNAKIQRVFKCCDHVSWVQKISDFGFAQLCNRTTTDKQTLKPSHRYIAPLQFRGYRSRRSDIYTVGLFMWELYTRKKPYGDIYEPASEANEGSRPSLDEIKSPELRKLIGMCWDWDKRDPDTQEKISITASEVQRYCLNQYNSLRMLSQCD